MKGLITAIALVSALFSAHAGGEDPVGGIDAQKITVSGVSSGANMAHQLHLAYPEIFSGAGIVAGAPFGCAAGSVTTAFARCMRQAGPDLDAKSLSAQVAAAAENGEVGKLELLADDRVWIFHGQLDTVIARGVVDATAELYREFLPPENVRYVTDVAAAHTFPTQDQGTACDVSESPFVGDCGFDTAGELLGFLYPGLDAPAAGASGAPQQVSVAGETAGLSGSAWLLVPPQCTAAESGCGLHLVLHGCGQAHAQVDMQFINMGGYVPWAMANDIVLAFPQVEPSAVNPLACWDWWGYTGGDYLTRSGAQMKFLADWARSLAGLAEG